MQSLPQAYVGFAWYRSGALYRTAVKDIGVGIIFPDLTLEKPGTLTGSRAR